MNQLRKILFPFSILYGLITDLRNFLYCGNILKRTRFSKPIIVVGNMSVGGTGKTPMVEYLVRLLQNHYTIATLSRGYKRKSKGFILASSTTVVSDIGDEPFQYHNKFPSVKVAVDANRVRGIKQLLSLHPGLDAVILDDAYQHLKVHANLNILLTTYSEPFYNDLVLPAGNLRETRKGSHRAQIIIVSKCPKRLTQLEQNHIKTRLNLSGEQHLFFTHITFDSQVYSKTRSIPLAHIDSNQIVLVAGIAKPDSFFEHLKTEETICLKFSDHHNFSKNDIDQILITAKDKKIITTEKDFMRLQNLIPEEQLYYLPIQTSFLNDEALFNQIIIDYVGENSRNR